jgi:integrase
MEDLFPSYLAYRQKQMRGLTNQRQISPRTLQEIEDKWRLYLCKLGRFYVTDITPVVWNKFIQTINVGDMANIRKVLTGFLSWCVQEGLLSAVPAFKIPYVVRRKRAILTPEEMQRLFSAAGPKLRLYIAMYLMMGMRNSEIVRLKWRDVDLFESKITIRPDTTRTRNGREIPINSHVLELLKEEIECARSNYVFPKRGKLSEHMIETGLMKAWTTALKRAGFPKGYLRPHDLRATYETYANKSTAFTDTQKEKFAGASMAVQRRFYVNMKADDLRGLEQVVPVRIPKAVLKDGEKVGKR